MDEAQTLANRVAVMRSGKIVAIGSPDELGGRGQRPCVIRFTLPAGAEPPPTPGAEVTRDGDRVKLQTTDPIRVTAAITAWAVEQGVELAGFSVTQPTLEDIYLELTGESGQ
jgi:ABC-type multidrug transport system ATPase subunit